MLQRRRVGMMIVVGALALAAALGLAVAIIIRSGTIERQIARLWAAELPGVLEVGAVRVPAPQQLRLTDVALRLAGDDVLRCAQVDVVGDLRAGSVQAVTLREPTIALRQASVPALMDFVAALQQKLAELAEAEAGPDEAYDDAHLAVPTIIIEAAKVRLNDVTVLTGDLAWHGAPAEAGGPAGKSTEAGELRAAITWFDGISNDTSNANNRDNATNASKAGVTLSGSYLPGEAVHLNSLTGSIPARALWESIASLWMDDDEIVTVARWLAPAMRLSAPNPGEVHIQPQGGWQERVIERIILGTLPTNYNHVHLQWQPTVARRKNLRLARYHMRLQADDGVLRLTGGAVPVHAVAQALAAHNLPTLGEQALLWLPYWLDLSTTSYDLDRRSLRAAVGFSMVESTKLLKEATPAEQDALVQMPLAQVIVELQPGELPRHWILNELSLWQGASGHPDVRRLKLAVDAASSQAQQGSIQQNPEPVAQAKQLVSGQGTFGFPPEGFFADIQLNSWAMPIAYEIWNDGLRLGDLAPMLPQVHWRMRPGEAPMLRASGPNAARFAWSPTISPWQMEIANIPLQYIESCDPDLTIGAGVAERGVVKGTWMHKPSGGLTVGSITVAVQAQAATANFLDWGAKEFSGHVSLNFIDRPLFLNELTATGTVPDLSYRMTRADRKEAWQLHTSGSDLGDALLHAQLPLPLPPIAGGAFAVSGNFGETAGDTWRARLQNVTLPARQVPAQADVDDEPPLLAEVTTELALDWQLQDEGGPDELLRLQGRGVATGGQYALAGVTLVPPKPMHFLYDVPIYLERSVGRAEAMPIQVVGTLGDPGDVGDLDQPGESAVASGSATVRSLDGTGWYDWRDEQGAIDLFLPHVDAAWAMSALRPWLGPTDGLGIAGQGPVQVDLTLASGTVESVAVDVGMLRHDLDLGVVQAQGVTGSARVTTGGLAPAEGAPKVPR